MLSHDVGVTLLGWEDAKLRAWWPETRGNGRRRQGPNMLIFMDRHGLWQSGLVRASLRAG
jgi:hypothetical protein